MGLNANNVPVTSKFKAPPLLTPGGYPARTVAVVDLGLQPQQYEGEQKEPAQEIVITYELLDEFMVDEDEQPMPDKPRWLTDRAFPLRSLSNDKARSTKLYKALDPTNKFGGDFSKLIDIPVTVTVVNNPNPKNPERPYENIGGVSLMRAKDAEKAPALKNAPVVFDFDNPDLEVFHKLPKFLQKRITEALNFKGSKLESLLDSGGKPPKETVTNSVSNDLDDDNPY